MALAWPDEDHVEDDHLEAERGRTTTNVLGSLASSPACPSVIAWLQEDDVAQHLYEVGTAVRVPWSDTYRVWLGCSPSPGTRRRYGDIWSAISSLREAIEELDEAVRPVGDQVAPVSKSLAEMAERLVGLRERLPVESPSSSDEAGWADLGDGQVTFDWRALNEEQAKGFPAPLYDEDGNELQFRPRAGHHNVFAEEYEEEGFLID